ncbi:amylo-alpha-1,6-glucosidase [Cohnella pontilimi]|uniref:Amylo-alpha-1,6-glucosidase n=1 Tax=Cohnella pontilimi TaxID=2564100 RepID=A0A4U0FDG8_9BACL|nr:amylo-alpha-1,6-glucosidase [Cohnella pontilimi]TJY42817.1 amylo-alpha-1,6-glucosidase [Cohnella pontilimi]
MEYRVIKENDLFLLTDLSGDISDSKAGQGLYTQDMRFLSKLTVTINGDKPILLASEADQNYISQILLTNHDVRENGELVLWRETVEIDRTRFIYEDVLYETIKATNFNPVRTKFRISVAFDADFADMFIVRGFQNGNVGSKKPIRQLESGVGIGYDGLDGVKRELLVEWGEKPLDVSVSAEGASVTYEMELEPGESHAVDLFFTPVIDGRKPQRHPQAQAIQALRDSYADWEQQSTAVTSDHDLFNRLYDRGLLDVRVLLTDVGEGRFPVAGLPWYAVPFGRDSLITALQMLPIHPELAKGTLLTMAKFQGEKVDEWRDEQPGKIMHELRKGELANTDQVPFTPYYGTVDATPLFLILLGEYVRWTDDKQLLEQLLPNVKRALEWIDVYGDPDGRGFTSYDRKSAKGISNQGWKDSGNSAVHRSGQFAEAPISLAEVQGYVYQAKRLLSELLPGVNGAGENMAAWSSKLAAEAEQLQERFEKEFWVESDQFYAMALDQDRKQVETVTSNPGHVLMSGMLQKDRAAAVAKKLVSKELFGGYGIRTMAVGETAYSPMSYHNGSVWPHDNSICLIGLASEGFHKEAMTVVEGLLLAGSYFENNRLPELYCGYSAEQGKPVPYPVACSPQAWAAATPLVFVQAMMGLRLDYGNREIALRPALPSGMNTLSVRRMRLGSGVLEIEIKRQPEGFVYEIVSNTTGWKIAKA